IERSTSSRTAGPSARWTPSGSASTRSRIAGSAMKPHLMTSAIPDTKSPGGNVCRVARSHRTPAGGWKAPTRFLPSAVLMPVLPPTAASTMPSRVVGTWTTLTPRSQVAARKPARSVTVPPPTPTIASERVKPDCPNTPHRRSATRADLASSASGTSAMNAEKPCAPRSSRTASPLARKACGWMTSTRSTPGPSRSGSSPSSAVPITTSYAESLPSPTRMRDASLTVGLPSLLQSLHDLGRDFLRHPPGGLDAEGRQPLIGGASHFHHLDPLRPRVERQQRPALAKTHPLGGIGDSHIEEHDGEPCQGRLGRGVHHCASTK